MPKEEQWLLNEKYNGLTCDEFYADCKRLALGEPLGYLIGHIPFLGATIYLDSKPLIPRPETEFWVEQACRVIREIGSISPRILDLCAGSGCIGVAVAMAVPDSHVDFSEIDAVHLPTILKNVQANDIANDRVSIFHTNLLEGLPGGYDFILTNPPYIDMSLNRTDENVLTHEPYLALSGGLAGMEIIEDVIKRAPLYLRLKGQLWIEHEPEQVSSISSLAKLHGFSYAVHTDQYGIERFSVLVLQ